MRQWVPVLFAILGMIPGLLVRFGVFTVSDPVRALWYGLAVGGAAFLLFWAAEAFQLDISAGLALALLAFVPVLPEYVIDASAAMRAVEDPRYAGYAVAGMTGANRLLIGLAWPLVVLIVWCRGRQRQIILQPRSGLEIVALLAATLYAFVLPIKGGLTLIDCAILASIFAVYVWRLARQPLEDARLVGPAAVFGRLPGASRRLAPGALAIAAEVVIFLLVAQFAEALIATGSGLGIDHSVLGRWVAPLASEAPELIVVSIFAWRLAGAAALGTLISCKLNQWTLLVAMLPLAYAMAMGGPASFPLVAGQGQEMLLTAAQSFLAVALLLSRRLTLAGAGLLFGLFAVQLVWPDVRTELSYVYIGLAIAVMVLARGEALTTVRGAFAAGGRQANAPVESVAD